MSDNIVNTRIKLATKSDSDWSELNPTLLSGEVGLDSTNKLIYVGDGTTAFNSLTAWNLLPTNLVTTDTNQNITGTKTFLGTKKVAFKQSGSSDKLGFTLYNSGGTEKGYLEYNPTNLIDGYPLMTIGNYASSASGITQVGFRRYSSVSGASGAYNLLMPLIADAKTPFDLTTTYTNFYLPLGFKNGSTMVTTAKSGVVDLGSLIPTPTAQVQSDWAQTNNTEVDYIKNKPTLATVATSGDYDDLTNKPTIPAAQVQSDWTQSDNTQVDYIKNKPTLATVATSGSYTDLSNTPTEIPTITTGDEGKVLTVNSTEDGVEWTDIPNELPTISSGDAGKALVVNSGETGVEWDTVSGLPPVTSANNGDTLEVVNGDWAVTDTLATTDDRLYNVEDMILNNRFFAPIATDAQTATLIVTDDDEAILSDWGLYVSGNDFVNVVNDNSTTNKISSTKIDWTDAPKELPNIESGDEGKVLTVNSTEDGVEWGTITGFLPLSGGTMTGAINLIDSSSVLDNSKIIIRGRYFGSINLADISTLERGSIGNNGEDVISQYRVRTAYIPVEENTSYRCSKPSGVQLYSVAYYSEKGIFSRKITPGADLNYTFTTSSGEKLVRLEFRDPNGSAFSQSSIAWLQVEKGSSSTDIVPYSLDSVSLSNRRYVTDWSSKNLADINRLEQGTIETYGNKSTFSYVRTIDYISVEPYTKYTFYSNINGAKVWFWEYDKQQNYLRYSGGDIDTGVYTTEITTGSDTKYIRFNIGFHGLSSNISLTDITSLTFSKDSCDILTKSALDNIELTNRRFVQDWESKNLLDISILQQGGLNQDGSTFASNQRVRTDFVKVTEVTTYTVSASSGTSPSAVRYYSDTSTVLSSYNNPVDHSTSFSFTTPSGTNYVRFVFVNATSYSTDLLVSDVKAVQLEKGINPTPFVPYALDNVELTKRVVPEYSSSQNGKVLGISSGSLAWVNNSGGGGTYYAGDGLALSDNTFRTSVVRVTTDANTLPSVNTFRVREYNSTSSNLPSANWYHIYEAKGNDGNYGTQLALGMTTNQVYYRSYQNGWQPWRKLDNNMYGTNFYSGGQNDQTHDCNAMTYNGNWYYTSNGPATVIGMTSTDGGIYSQFHSTSWGGQIAQDYRDGELAVRGKDSGNWTPWERIPLTKEMMGLTVSKGYIVVEPLKRKIIKYSTSESWNAQAYSECGYTTSCYVAFKPEQTNKAIMAGFDSNPSQDASYQNIDYCWYIRNDGKAEIYESNTSGLITAFSYAVGDDFRIEYDGKNVNYYHNGSLKRSVGRAVSGKLYFDSSFHGSNGCIYDFSFGPSTIATNTLSNTFTVTRGSSVSTSTSGFWAAMCNSTSTGSPVLPSANQWWHVLSLDWSGNDTSNWVSQLALPTQQNSSIYWRRNSSGNTSIDSASWVKVLDVSNYNSYALPLTGGSLTGSLSVTSNPSTSNYNEGIRINQGKGGVSTLLLGGTANSTTGTNDGAWWIGTVAGNIGAYGRKLWIAHNGSTNSNTYFHAPNSSTISPYLQLGSSGSVASGDSNAVNGNAVYSWLANNMSVAATGNRLVQRSAEGYIYGVYYNQSSNVENSLFSASCNIMYSGSDNWVRKTSWTNIMQNYLFPVFTRGDGPGSVISNDNRVIIDEGSYMVHKFGWASNATGVVTVTIRLHSTADTGTRIYFATLPKPAAPVGILPFSYNTGKVANAAWYYLSTDGRLSNTGSMYSGEPHCLSFSYVSATNEFA